MRNTDPTEPTRIYSRHIAIIFFSFLIVFMGMGARMLMGVFMNPIITDLNWSRAALSGALSINFVIEGTLGILMGRLTDRFGPRAVIGVCGLFLGATFLSMSRMTAYWQVYLFYGVIGGIGISGVIVPTIATISRWFVRKRTMITGLVLSGSSVAGITLPIFATWLISQQGWRFSLLAIGILILLIYPLSAVILVHSPNRIGLLPYGFANERDSKNSSDTKGLEPLAALRTKQFWIIFVILGCGGLMSSVLFAHVILHVIDLGYSATIGAGVLSLFTGISILGNISLGGLGDKIGNRNVLIICFFVYSVSMIWMAYASAISAIYLLAAVLGIFYGGINASQAPVVASFFGTRSLGILFGIQGMGITFAAGLGVYIAGFLADRFGGYRIDFIFSACVAMLAFLLTICLRPIKKAE